tara:strand:+ start:539 stop:658 length:120 start_codon:yes stop_codon:yes gene_type:complete
MKIYKLVEDETLAAPNQIFYLAPSSMEAQDADKNLAFAA